MNYHKNTGYLLEPDELTSPSKEHLNAFETAYGLRVNDEGRGEPLLMQRFRKRAATRPETIQIQVEENGRRVTYSSPPPRPRPVPLTSDRAAQVPAPRPASVLVLPRWAEVYRAEIEALWHLTSPETAARTARLLFEKFTEFLRQRDWLGAEATLQYLETGATGRLPHMHVEGNRSKKKKKAKRKGGAHPVALSAELRDLFRAYAERARTTPEYLRQREAQGPGSANAQTN